MLVETLAESLLVALVGGAAGLPLAVAALSVASGPLGVDLSLAVARRRSRSLAAAGLSGVAVGLVPGAPRGVARRRRRAEAGVM